MHTTPDYTAMSRAGRESECALGLAKQPTSQRTQANDMLANQVQTVFEDSQQTYGSRRSRMALRGQGMRCGRARVVCLIRQLTLQVPFTRKHSVTTKANPRDPSGENKLACDFTVSSQIRND